jgi:hypothetical protein
VGTIALGGKPETPVLERKGSVVGNVKTQDGARTMAVDPKTHHVFVITAGMKSAAPPTKEEPDPRRPILPGTFVVLELAP